MVPAWLELLFEKYSCPVSNTFLETDLQVNVKETLKNKCTGGRQGCHHQSWQLPLTASLMMLHTEVYESCPLSSVQTLIFPTFISLQPNPVPMAQGRGGQRGGTIKGYFPSSDKVNRSFLFGWWVVLLPRAGDPFNEPDTRAPGKNTCGVSLSFSDTQTTVWWKPCVSITVRLTPSLFLSKVAKGVGRHPLSFLLSFIRRKVKRQRPRSQQEGPCVCLAGILRHSTWRSVWQTSQMLTLHFFSCCFWAQCSLLLADVKLAAILSSDLATRKLPIIAKKQSFKYTYTL